MCSVRGRKPKPQAIKELTGRDHHGKKNSLVELDIDATADEVVEDYDSYDTIPGARELWNSLYAAGIVKTSDRVAFLRYAQLLSEYVEAANDVKARGQILNKNMSNERYNPSWRVMLSAQQELTKLEVEFGLTPSAKRRVMQPVEAATSAGGGDNYADLREAQLKKRQKLRK